MRVLLILLQAVVVQPPATSIVSSLTRLHDICGPGSFDACTRFVAYRLDVQCVTRSGEPAMNASVTFRPMIFVYNIRQLPHEMLHVDDVRLFASQYVNQIESVPLKSDQECQEQSIRLAAGFGDRIREFALRSNLERHPILRTGRSTMPHVEGR
jgi:hypothetical protein